MPAKFQKRHYVALADALHKARLAGMPWTDAAEFIVRMLEQDNENFQPDRFLLACREGVNAKGVGAGIQGGPAMPYFQGNTPMDTAASRNAVRAARRDRR